MQITGITLTTSESALLCLVQFRWIHASALTCGVHVYDDHRLRSICTAVRQPCGCAEALHSARLGPPGPECG
jgi:hypothetical protein